MPQTPSDDATDDEWRQISVPDEELIMPAGDLPVVREGTVGGIPSYEDDQTPPLI